MGKRSSKIWFTLLAISIELLGHVPVAQAEAMDWSSFTRTLNDTFSGKHALSPNNILVLIIILLAVILLATMTRLYQVKQKQSLSKFEVNREKRQNKVSLSPANTKQQRNWFRIRSSMMLKWIPSYKATKVKESQYEKAELLDISGGGLNFSTNSPLKLDDELTFFLDVGSKKPLSLKGRVLRVEEKSEQAEPRYHVAIQFGNLLTGERDRLVSWIMKGERSLIHETKHEDSIPSSD